MKREMKFRSVSTRPPISGVWEEASISSVAIFPSSSRVASTTTIPALKPSALPLSLAFGTQSSEAFSWAVTTGRQVSWT